MRTVTIIGANGFIGKHLSKMLAANKQVKLNLFSRKFSPFFDHPIFSNTELITGDYTNLLTLVSVLKNSDIVYHLVSSSFPANSWINPNLDIETNLIPSVNLFKLCADLEVKKVVFVSSGGAVYGKQNGEMNEKSILAPFSPYGIIKVTIENFLRYFKEKSELNYEIYRVTNAYGPYLDKKGFGVINTWVRNAIEQKSIKIYGQGYTVKDYIFVSDVACILSKVVDKNLETCETYNLASGHTSSLLEILDLIEKKSPFLIDKDFIKVSDSDNQKVILSNAKLMKDLDQHQFVSIEEGIEALFKFYRK